MEVFYINGYDKKQVENKIKELKSKYQITNISVGRFIGTAQYYGDIYYTTKGIEEV